jgi:hypothetical protein
MTFERYLAERRREPVRFGRRNPHADSLAKQLNANLDIVRRWLSGDISTGKMRAAMEFFNKTFPGQYEAVPGSLIYRGQEKVTFDGSPRSYSYDKTIAESFACNAGSGPFGGILPTKSQSAYVIRRKVCSSCKDRDAFALSLDLDKVLQIYGAHKYGIEAEVVILNTPPVGPTAKVSEGDCA